jgi:hypothetical protein
MMMERMDMAVQNIINHSSQAMHILTMYYIWLIYGGR